MYTVNYLQSSLPDKRNINFNPENMVNKMLMAASSRINKIFQLYICATKTSRRIIVIRIRSLFLQCTILLLLAFTGLAGVSFSLFTAEMTEQEQEISSGSVSAIVESLSYLKNPDGGDDDNGNGDNFLNQPTHLFYPLSANEGKNTVLSLQHSFIGLYLLYHRLIFYHPVA